MHLKPLITHMKDKDNKEKFDWLPLVGIGVVINIFVFKGIAWGIVSFVLVAVIMGWNKRHN